MDIFKSKPDGSMSNPLLVLIGLMVISLIASFRLKESAMVIKTDVTEIDDLIIVKD